MVKAAEHRETDNARAALRALHIAMDGRILPEGEVVAGFVVIALVGTEQLSRMRLAKDDDVVEQVAAD